MSTSSCSVIRSIRWGVGILLATVGAFSALGQETITGELSAPVSWAQLLEAQRLIDQRGEREEPRAVPEGQRPKGPRLRRSDAQPLVPTGRVVPAPLTLHPDPLSGRKVRVQRNFEALLENREIIPPDTMGAVGPNHLVTMVNTQVRMQDKAGTDLGLVNLEVFWTSGTGLTGSPFDPHIEYDRIAQRWYATCCANGNMNTSKVFVAVSDTDDPTKTWRFKEFNADQQAKTWADYPGFGFNKNWLMITMNMFEINGDYVGPKAWVLDKVKLLTGTFQAKVLSTRFDKINVDPGPPVLDTGGFTLKPCVSLDPNEEKLYIVDNWPLAYLDGQFVGIFYDDDGTPLIRVSELRGTPGSPAWYLTPGALYPDEGWSRASNPYLMNQINAEQKGDPRGIDTNDWRIANVLHRDGHVWFTHSAGLPFSDDPGAQPDRTAVFWYQLNPLAMATPFVQSGVISEGAGSHFIFPSIAVNSAGDACIGFSRSSSQIYVEAGVAARAAEDPPGTLQPILTLKAGEDSYFQDYGYGANRWGDYSAVNVDPTDDRTFWAIQEYAETRTGGNWPARWGTWWGEVAFIDDCNGNGVADQDDLANCDGSPWCKDCNGNDQIDVCEQLQPVITVQPQPLQACRGAQAQLSVTATGNGELKYQWRKDGTAIGNATGNTLTIPAAQLEDAGVYDVVVADACTSELFAPVTSGPAQLTVVQLLINSQPQSTVAVAGEAVTLAVVAAGPEPLTYQWRRNGDPIADATSANILIRPVMPGNAGSYDVVVTSPCGSLTSTAAILTVTLSEATGPYPLDKAEDLPVAGQYLSWGSVLGATEYRVYFGTTPTPGLLTTSAANSAQLPALAYSTRYFWRIEARNGALLSMGPLWSFTTAPPPPSPPAEPSGPFPPDGATNVELNVRLSWAAAEGAQIYKLLLSRDADFGEVLFAGSTLATRWSTEPFEPNTTYYWRILAKNEVGTTAGPVWSFTTGAKSDSGTDQPIENDNDAGQDIPNGNQNDNAVANDNVVTNANDSGNGPSAPLCPLSAGIVTALAGIGLWLTWPRRH